MQQTQTASNRRRMNTKENSINKRQDMGARSVTICTWIFQAHHPHAPVIQRASEQPHGCDEEAIEGRPTRSAKLRFREPCTNASCPAAQYPRRVRRGFRPILHRSSPWVLPRFQLRLAVGLDDFAISGRVVAVARIATRETL